MPKLPEIGDTILIRGVVTGYPTKCGSRKYIRYKNENGKDSSVFTDLICEVIPKPWAPKAGDNFKAKNGTAKYNLCYLGKSLAFVKSLTSDWEGVIYSHNLKEAYELCVD